MKLSKNHSRMLVSTLSLFALPLAFAGGADKKLNKLDTDGDGQVSRVEHAAGAKRMFAEMDTSGDGVVTATEMDTKHARDGDKSRHELSAIEKIRSVDQNADGRLTATEHASSSDTMFARMDANEDGALDKKELEAGHKLKMKGKRQ